jgi:hypothetical protein
MIYHPGENGLLPIEMICRLLKVFSILLPLTHNHDSATIPDRKGGAELFQRSKHSVYRFLGQWLCCDDIICEGCGLKYRQDT